MVLFFLHLVLPPSLLLSHLKDLHAVRVRLQKPDIRSIEFTVTPLTTVPARWLFNFKPTTTATVTERSYDTKNEAEEDEILMTM